MVGKAECDDGEERGGDWNVGEGPRLLWGPPALVRPERAKSLVGGEGGRSI